MQRVLYFLPSVAMLMCLNFGFASRTAMALQDEWRSVAGEWKGEYSNSTGNHGETLLSLRERDNGSLYGDWDGVEVNGRRINRDTIELRGENSKVSYQITGTRDGRAMVLKYMATRLNTSGGYDGEARLYRRH